jgi:thiopeptide-type bacteriocin biosynthesis protein
LNTLLVSQSIRNYRWAIYEPEQRRFGGVTGMEIAHSFWSIDSELVLEYELLSRSQKGPLPRAAFWAMLVNDLLRRSLSDAGEIWDVWRALEEAAGQLNTGDTTSGRYTKMARLLFTIPHETALLLPSEARVLRDRARKANERTSKELLASLDAGTMKRGLREWLAANSIFQANRWGIGADPQELCAITGAMTRLLEPDHAPSRTALSRTRDT